MKLTKVTDESDHSENEHSPQKYHRSTFSATDNRMNTYFTENASLISDNEIS
jgi:hypothetical protein